jgi:hypothetical protein
MTLDAFFDHVQGEVVPAGVKDMEKYVELAKRYPHCGPLWSRIAYGGTRTAPSS